MVKLWYRILLSLRIREDHVNITLKTLPFRDIDTFDNGVWICIHPYRCWLWKLTVASWPCLRRVYFEIRGTNLVLQVHIIDKVLLVVDNPVAEVLVLSCIGKYLQSGWLYRPVTLPSLTLKYFVKLNILISFSLYVLQSFSFSFRDIRKKL